MYRLHGKPKIITGDETLEVVRTDVTNIVDGVWTKQSESNFQIKKCNVQPVDGRTLLLEPEGDRFREQYFIWALNPHPPNAVIKVNDRVVRFGSSFQVQKVENWGSYVKALMMAIDVGPNRGSVDAPNTAV